MRGNTAMGEVVAVVGGTGRLGVHCVSALQRTGAQVRVIARGAAGIVALPDGAQGYAGDLDLPPSLAPALDGATAMMLITTNGPRETAQGSAAVAAAITAGVRRIAFLSLPRTAPHYGVKRPVEDAIVSSGLEACILRSNYFNQTDLGMRASILDSGIYPLPIGSVGVSRVDCRDIAAIAAAMLTRAGAPEPELDLSGPAPLSGEQVAACWSSACGKPVRYVGDDLDAWCASLATVPEALRLQMRALMEFFQRGGGVAPPGNARQLEAIIGRPLLGFGAFATEVAEAWRAAVNAA